MRKEAPPVRKYLVLIEASAPASKKTPPVGLKPDEKSSEKIGSHDEDWPTGVGSGVGPRVGPEVGPGVGPEVGPTVGPEEGVGVGPAVGSGVGPGIGTGVGPRVGPEVGPGVGPEVGGDEGAVEGLAEIDGEGVFSGVADTYAPVLANQSKLCFKPQILESSKKSGCKALFAPSSTAKKKPCVPPGTT